MAYSSSTTTECVLTCGYSQKDAPNEVDDLRRQIQALQAAVTELERKVDERGKLLRVSEEIRAQLTKDNHDLKEINAQLRYLSTPAPFQEQYLFKVRGTPPSAKVSRIDESSNIEIPVEPASFVYRKRGLWWQSSHRQSLESAAE